MFGKMKPLETFEQKIDISKPIFDKDWLQYARQIGAGNMEFR